MMQTMLKSAFLTTVIAAGIQTQTLIGTNIVQNALNAKLKPKIVGKVGSMMDTAMIITTNQIVDLMVTIAASLIKELIGGIIAKIVENVK